MLIALRIVGIDPEHDIGVFERGIAIFRMKAVSKVSLLMTPRRIPVCCEIAVIKFQRQMKQPQRLFRLGRRVRMSVRQRTQVKVVRIEAVWPLAARTIDLGTADGRLDCSDDLLVSWSCRSKMSATAPSNLPAQIWLADAPSMSCPLMRILLADRLTLPSNR